MICLYHIFLQIKMVQYDYKLRWYNMKLLVWNEFITLNTYSSLYYTEQKKETSHAFLHAFQQKYTIFRYRQVCLICERYQATRCTNWFLISTNCRRVIPIRVNARNPIENAKCACASSLFLLGRLQDITTNQIHFEHEQILKTVSRKKKIKHSST